MTSWYVQTLVAVALLVPGWLALAFFQRNFSLSSSTVLVLYTLGMIIGIVSWHVWQNKTLVSFFPAIGLSLTVIMSGILFGAYGNVLMVNSIDRAPNPGLPIAIGSTASILVFVATLVLAYFFPRFFNQASIHWQHVTGILLTILGVSLVAIK